MTYFLVAGGIAVAVVALHVYRSFPRWYPHRRRYGPAFALAQKPRVLPPVEAELQPAPPRAGPWTGHDGTPLCESYITTLTNYVATRAWVVAFERRDDDPEGPDYYVNYSYEAGGELYETGMHRGYDRVHLGLPPRGVGGWIGRAFRLGGTFTVLYDPINPAKHVVFGDMDLFVGGRWVAQ